MNCLVFVIWFSYFARVTPDTQPARQICVQPQGIQEEEVEERSDAENTCRNQASWQVITSCLGDGETVTTEVEEEIFEKDVNIALHDEMFGDENEAASDTWTEDDNEPVGPPLTPLIILVRSSLK